MNAGRERLGRAVSCALLAASLAAGPAGAQTTVDPGAVDQLAPAPPSDSATPAKPTPRPGKPSGHPTARHVPIRTQAKPPVHNGGKPNPHAALPGTLAAPHAAVKPGSATLSAAPPPAPVLPPPIIVPTRPIPPPPPVPVVADAPGVATPQKDGLRITFGAGGSNLNPATDAALRGLAHAAPPFAATTFTVTAYAAGNADDPSTPRRLALARGLAVRSVLIAEGIPSARIYVRALGASVPPSDSAPDRVDIVASTPAPADQQGQSRPP